MHLLEKLEVASGGRLSSRNSERLQPEPGTELYVEYTMKMSIKDSKMRAKTGLDNLCPEPVLFIGNENS